MALFQGINSPEFFDRALFGNFVEQPVASGYRTPA
jgi:glycerol-3-phosphate O-acyltransferase